MAQHHEQGECRRVPGLGTLFGLKPYDGSENMVTEGARQPESRCSTPRSYLFTATMILLACVLR
jgi:hypothetical protein